MGSDFDKFLKKYGKDDQISGTDIRDATKEGYSFSDLDKFTKKANDQGLKSGISTQKQLDQVAQLHHQPTIQAILPLGQQLLISI